MKRNMISPKGHVGSFAVQALGRQLIWRPYEYEDDAVIEYTLRTEQLRSLEMNGEATCDTSPDSMDRWHVAMRLKLRSQNHQTRLHMECSEEGPKDLSVLITKVATQLQEELLTLSAILSNAHKATLESEKR